MSFVLNRCLQRAADNKIPIVPNEISENQSLDMIADFLDSD